MNKSDIIKELYEETVKAEESTDSREKKIHELNCYELNLILENWKESYEREN